MIEQDKIKLMTKLAVYDKNHKNDKKMDTLFRHDYIYKNNLSIRVGVIIACLILLAYYMIYIFFVQHADVFVMDIKAELFKVGVFVGGLLIIYTIIGGLRSTVLYHLAQKRLANYYRMLNQLDGIANVRPRKKKKISREA